MKIRRFNENQQYLTVPFDPEFGLTINVNIKTWWKEFEQHLKIMAKELGNYKVVECKDSYNLIMEINDDKLFSTLYNIEFKISVSVPLNSIYINAIVNRDEDDDRNFECGGMDFNIKGLKEQLLELLYESGIKDNYED